MPELVSSIRGEISLDSSNYKKGIDEAKKATQGLNTLLADAEARFKATGSEEARATISAHAHMEAEKRLAEEVKRTGLALSQETAYLKEMAAAEARLTSIHQGESRAVQDVAAKYHELTAAERQELVATQSAIATHEAQQKALAKLGAEAERMPQRLRMMGRAMNQVGREMTQLFTVPIAAAGAAILKSGIDVDHGMDQIRLATGATGDRLKGLEASFKAVGGTVPQSLQQVGQALGTVATRTGLTGPPLEALTRRLLTMQRLMGGDLAGTLQLSTRLFGDWGVKVGDQSKVLDLLGRAHQITGISIAKLSQQLVQFGAPLRTVGFSLEQSVALFGKWNKEGVNAEQVATSIRIAIGRMVKAGVKDVPGAFQEAIKAIQAAKTPADQLSLSFKLFGARAGTDMARAIKEGRFAIGDLVKTLQQGSGTLDDAAKKTDDFGQRFAQLRNKVELALNPLGSRLMDALDNLGKSLIANVPRLTALVDGFTRLPQPVQRAAEAVLLIVAGAGPALMVLGKLVQAWGALSLVMKSAEAQAILTRIAIGGPWIAAAIAAIALLVAAWNDDFGGMRTAIVELGKEISDWWENRLKPFFAGFAAGFKDVASSASHWFSSIAASWEGITSRIERSPLGKRILGAIRTAGQAQMGALGGLIPGSGVGLQAAGLVQRAQNRALMESGEGGFGAPILGPRRPLGPPVPAGFKPSGANPPDWMTRLGKTGATPEDTAQKRALEEQADALYKLNLLKHGTNEADAEFLTQHRLLAPAMAHHLLDLQHQEDAYKKHADALKAAAAATKKLREEREHETQAALKHAEQILAANKDIQRQIAEGGMVSHGIAAQVPHPKADPAARAVEQAAQVEHDRLVARLGELNKARHEARAAEEALRKLWAGPAKVADDPQLNALHARTKAATDAAAARRKYLEDEKHATEEGVKAFEEEAKKRLHFGKLLLEQQQKEQEELFALGGSTVMPKDALEALRMQAEKLRKELGKDEGFANFDAGMKRLTAGLHKGENEATKFLRTFAEGTQQVFENMFTNLAEHGFKGLFKSILDDFKQMLVHMAAAYLASQLVNLIFGKADANTGERAGGWIEKIVGAFTHHAGGGSVMGGQPIWTGERGTELFVPPSNGRIVPNNQIAGAMGGNSTVNIHLHGITDYSSFKRNEGQMIGTMNRESERMRRRNGNG